MPAITLDSEARAMLENHYWRGNIRQLKNVAEQISAIEESRDITAAILAKYIGEHHETSPSPNSAPCIEDINSERELLYKILFDMRSDINDLKRMVSDLHGGFSSYRGMSDRGDSNEVKALLPHSSHNEEYYAESEVVEEVTHKELTKADMQREQIVAALRSNNGRRRDAARQLFMSERTLYRRIKELGITDDDI
jgi:DNA-binding NtrC family response regulator